MREACLHYNWSFVPIYLKLYRALMRWTPWRFFFFFWGGGGSDDESPRWGHSPRMSGGSGVKVLSQILSDESLSYSLKHIYTGEHSLHISWRSIQPLFLYFLFSRWRHEMEICSALLTFVRGFTGHWWIPLTVAKASDAKLWCFFSICAWTNGWVNNQDSDDLRRCRSMVCQWAIEITLGKVNDVSLIYVLHFIPVNAEAFLQDINWSWCDIHIHFRAYSTLIVLMMYNLSNLWWTSQYVQTITLQLFQTHPLSVRLVIKRFDMFRKYISNSDILSQYQFGQMLWNRCGGDVLFLVLSFPSEVLR